MQSIWGKRFQGRKNDSELDSFNASIKEDCFLWEEEIEVALAYAEALFHSGIITMPDLEQIKAGLKTVRERIEKGEDLSSFEDIHSAVELMLTQEIGETGKKLATGRSRNELVATVERRYLMKKYANS
ncbi:MAG: lyase family protein [Candidatus Aminicenantales bacterium]